MPMNMTEDEWDDVHRRPPQGPLRARPGVAAVRRVQSLEGGRRGAAARRSTPRARPALLGNPGQANDGAAKAGIGAFTIIVAQELRRYGVPHRLNDRNARTADRGDVPDPRAVRGLRPTDLTNVSTVVVALCAGTRRRRSPARSSTSRGGAVNALRGWSADELFAGPTGWEPDALLAELLARFPEGASPPGTPAGDSQPGRLLAPGVALEPGQVSHFTHPPRGVGGSRASSGSQGGRRSRAGCIRIGGRRERLAVRSP